MRLMGRMKHIYAALSAMAQTSSFLASTIAWLGCLGTVCLVRARPHPQKIPRNRFGNNEVISVQDWLATRGMPQPLAQRLGRNGYNVSKETVVKTVQSNLMELRARHGRVHGRRGRSAAPPSKPDLTAVVNTAAPHQTFERGRTHTPLTQQRERTDPEKSLVGGAAEIDVSTIKDASGTAEEASPARWTTARCWRRN